MKLVKRNISLLDLIALVAAIVLIVYFSLKGIIYFSIGSEELQTFAKEWQRQMLGIAVLVAFTPIIIFGGYILFVKVMSYFKK